MPLQHAVLALLADGPSHGYDLKARFADVVGPQWGLNIGHLYQVLDRLHRDHLVEAETVPQPRRPDRTVYHITPAGLAELRSWLEAPVTRNHGYRDDFFLKLIASARQGPDQLSALIRAQRQQDLQELRSLTDAASVAGAEPLTKLLLDAAILHTRANLQLIDLTEQRASALLAHVQQAKHSRGAPPVTDDTPAPAPGHATVRERPRRTRSR
jgi:DNA-binding PadR family transcriptional regulator